MSIDLSAMTIAELKSMKKAIDKEIKTKEKIAIKEQKKAQREALKNAQRESAEKEKRAKKELMQKAKELGVDINTIFSSTQKETKPAVQKYANPADNSQTWSGRGRQPKWVVSALESGKTLEDLTI